jgi:hypothetical protein
MVPQRVDPENDDRSEGSTGTEQRPTQGTETPGADVFLAAIAELEADEQLPLLRLAEWACSLEREGLCRLSTYQGVGANRYTLLPRLQPDNAGLVTVWNDHGSASMQFWRSVFERRAPRTLADIASRYGDDAVKQGNTAPDADDELLRLLTAAYHEANGR